MKSYPLDTIVILFSIVFVIGFIVGFFITIIKTSRISKKDVAEFEVFLTQREERRKHLVLQAKVLQNNY